LKQQEEDADEEQKEVFNKTVVTVVASSSTDTKDTRDCLLIDDFNQMIEAVITGIKPGDVDAVAVRKARDACVMYVVTGEYVSESGKTSTAYTFCRTNEKNGLRDAHAGKPRDPKLLKRLQARKSDTDEDCDMNEAETVLADVLKGTRTITYYYFNTYYFYNIINHI